MAVQVKAKGTTWCLGTDCHVDSKHWERDLGLCDKVTALTPTAGLTTRRRGEASVPPWVLAGATRWHLAEVPQCHTGITSEAAEQAQAERDHHSEVTREVTSSAPGQC